MKLIRDRATKEVKLFWDEIDPQRFPFVGTPHVEDADTEEIDLPGETRESFQKKCKDKAVDGKVGKIFLHPNDELQVASPDVRVEGLLGELETIRTSLGKKDNEAVTFGDIKQLHEKTKKEKYERIGRE